MKFIIKNPYRILGLSIFSNQREITKRISNLNIQLDIGLQPHYSLDLNFISNFKRNSILVDDSSHKLENPSNRLFYSIFWFHFETTFDKIIKELIEKQQLLKAYEFLNKSLEVVTNSRERFLLKKNLTVISLELFYKKEMKDLYLKTALSNFSDILKDKYWDKFSYKITQIKNKDFKSDILELFIENFIDELYQKIKDEPGKIKDIIIIFRDYFPTLSNLIEDQFISLPTLEIDKSLQNLEKTIADNIEKTFEYTLSFYEKTKHNLFFIKEVLSKKNLSYQTLADKAASTILKNSISFFNHFQDSDEIDPGKKALKMTNFAKEFAVGDMVKNKINKNLPILEDWVDSEKEREKKKKIKNEINEIDKIMNQVEKEFSEQEDFPDDFIDSYTKYIDQLIGIFERVYEKSESTEPFVTKMTDAVLVKFIQLLNDFVSNTQKSVSLLHLKNKLEKFKPSDKITVRLERLFTYIEYVKS